MRQSIELSSCKLDLRHDALRMPARPFALRHPDFEDEFDFTTLFNDIFWNDEGTGLILIGPPLLNLREDLVPRFVALPSGDEVRPLHARRLWIEQISLAVPPGTTALAIECASVRFVVVPQPSLVGMFKAKRVIFAMSKNNSLEWIRDWARFYALEHGCEAVLLYDNNSDRYGLADIDVAIRSAHDGIEVAVLAWPFPYGVFDGRRERGYRLWDSFFSQPAIFEHARWRFLASARSVINADIDELCLSDSARSIFEIAEQSQTGYLRYDGWWIENHLSSTPLATRHADFCLRKRHNAELMASKWAAVPSRCPHSAQWYTHWIFGMSPDMAGADVYLRHLRAINTDWDVHDYLSAEQRTRSYGGDPADLEVDEPLQQSHQRVFTGGWTRDIGLDDSGSAEAKAYRLRVLAGQARNKGDGQEAIALAAQAQQLLPSHPGLAAYLAELLQDKGEVEDAQRFQREAARILEEQPAHHWQLGCVALSRGDREEGISHLRRAVELDPGLVEACTELVASAGGDGAKDANSAMLRDCLKALASDDHLSLAEVARLCLRMDMHEEALAAIDQAIATQPRWNYHGLRARILAAGNDTAGAISAFQAAIACASNPANDLYDPDEEQPDILRAGPQDRTPRVGQGPGHAGLYGALANLLIRQGRAPEAEKVAHDGLEAAAMSPQAWLLLAKCLTLNGKHGEAEQAMTKCRELSIRIIARLKRLRQSTAQIVALIGVLAEAGACEAAEVEITSARSSGLADWRLERIGAEVALKRGLPEDAAACLQRAIALAPRRMGLYVQLARLRANEKKWPEAAETWRALTKAAPDNAHAHNAFGRSLTHLDDVEGAIAAMQQAVRLKADEAEWHCNLGALLARRGQWSAAAEACQRALELAPGLSQARRLLEECGAHQ